MKTEHEEREGMFVISFFLSTNQRTRSRFVRVLTITAKAEGSFEKRFSETVRQLSVVYALDTRSLFLRRY